MSRISKWKVEKAKVKVVFRLQFHATHIPQTGWDKLFVSLIPTDSGKATAKTTKVNVRNGTCKWGDPIYETTRLLQDPRTKEYDAKLYKLVVAMGSSRSSFLGEANINLADYADASKPCTVALPLHGCDSGAFLHVTVQLLTSKTGFREFEQQRELREKGFHTLTKQTVRDPVQILSASTEMANDQVDVRVRVKSESRELPSLEEVVELNEEHADSAVGIDDSSNTSESIYAEKHDTSIVHEIDSFQSSFSGDLGGLSLGQSHQPEKKDPSDLQILRLGSNDWGHGSSSDYSLDNDLTTAYEENSRLRESLEVAESSILELKLLVSTLQNDADALGSETHKFSEQLAAEIASGERLAKEVSLLKSECSKLKFDFEQLQHSRSSPPITNKEIIEEPSCLLLDVQMKWVQGLLAVEDKLREIQNKACVSYSDCDVSFLSPDLEALQHILQDLKQGTTDVSVTNLLPMDVADMEGIGAMTVQRPEPFTGEDVEGGLEGSDANDPLSEGMFHRFCRPGQISGKAGPIDVTSAMETKICELLRELEESKAERESLARKMGQMECYYEALVQGLEESQKQMLGELQSLRNEHSSCLYTISSCKTQMETVHQDMNDQLLKFAEDRHNLESFNKELEKRAITSEAALRRARLNYSVAVDRLQKDLELLSFQVLSMFETNENLIKQAFAEGSQLCFQEYVETVDRGNAPLLDQCKTLTQGNQAVVKKSEKAENNAISSDKVIPLRKVLEPMNLATHSDLVPDPHRTFYDLDPMGCTKDELPGGDTSLETKLDFLESDHAKLLFQHQNSDPNNQFLGGEVLLEDLKRLLHFQEDRYQMVEAELYEMHVVNMDLDVLSKVLQETLHDTCDCIGLMKEKMDELARQLEHSTESKELVILQLKTALEDVNTLSEYKASCVTKCNDLALQTEILEEKLESIFNENCLLTKKITEYEGLMMEYGSYKSKYSACTAENMGLSNLLKQETLEKTNLLKEISSLNEKLTVVEAEFDNQVSARDNLERNVIFLQDNLGELMSTMLSYREQLNAPVLHGESLQQDLKYNNITNSIFHLGELQKEACEKIIQLTQEKKAMEEERDVARRSLSGTESEILSMKRKFAFEMQDIVARLALTDAHVEKLQLKLENFANRLKYRSESEENYSEAAEQNQEIFSKVELLEVELQHVVTENMDLAQKILDFESVNEELERTKLAVSSIREENHVLLTSLAAGNEESVNLAMEFDNLKQSLRCVNAELNYEKGIKAELEGTVADLTTQLNEKHDQLLGFEQQKAELVNFQKEACEKIIQLTQEKKAMEEERDVARRSLSGTESEILSMRQKFAFEMQDIVAKLALAHAHVEKLQLELENFSNKLKYRSESEENYSEAAEQNQEIFSKVELLEVELQHVVTENMDLAQKILAFESVNEELEKTKLAVFNIRQENHVLLTTLAAGNEESVKLAMEFDNLKETLKCVNAELNFEKGIRAELEGKVADLTTQLNEKHDQLLGFDQQRAELVNFEKCIRAELEGKVAELTAQLNEKHDQLLHFDQHKSELVNLKQLVSDLELQKSRVSSLLVHSESCLKETDENASSLRLQVTELEMCLAEVYEYLLAADVELVFTRNQFQTRVQELSQQFDSLDRHHEELSMKHHDVLTTLNRHISTEGQYVEENAQLLTTLESLTSELEASVNERKVLLDKDKVRSAELEKFKTEATIAEGGDDIKHDPWHEHEVEQLKHMLGTFEEEVNMLRSSRDELEITVTVLRAKLDEQFAQISLPEEYDDELMMLQNRCNELTRKLSEQLLKTEEFKNLSIHLKELKDKADAETIQAQEKKETEGLSATMQESLRIAFIREQSETKLQELRNQLYISKKHSEEMLLKLQDSLDEVENRKKSEASHIKRNKELSLKILELETELQSVLFDKREMVKAYDGMKVELECSLISLDCCKEDKQKLEASLQECEEEKSRIVTELRSMKEQLRSSAFDISTPGEGHSRPGIGKCMSSEQFSDVQREALLDGDRPLNSLDRDTLLRCNQAEDTCSLSSNGSSQSGSQMTLQSIQDSTVLQSVLGSPIQAITSEEALLQINEKNVTLISDHLKAQSLKSSMDFLHEELERIKNENLASSLSHDDHQCEPAFPGLQKELLQLHKANEQLGSLFPFFNKFSMSGNALERVLALEIELAEALQAKKKSSIHFQSSFLKQHSDEEAIYQSFRDINELIKDMLELKERYRTVENELKEMHGRYTELSLQFAEVEGERQRLLMTLKNVRVPKKSSRLNFSSLATAEDLS